ncbi:MAG: uracil-DNA glycosylase [Nitrospirae bacterium]|nr:uracil-DNA glycosylase [Nitrospirota bacterium]
MANITDDIKNILEFYQALGFERLPIKTVTSKKHNSKLNSSLVTHHSSLKSKEAALNALREEIGNCKRCKLSKGRTNIVFGEGDPEAEIMFIGEAPGKDEDIQGRPFVGDAGKLLTSLIEKMGFKREEVYIANIIKCRPPYNRDPEEDEINTCKQFIERQIKIINPKVIVSLGRVSAQSLLMTKIPISKLRGQLFNYAGIPFIPTFHPAYLLRNPKDKWLTWKDAQAVLKLLKQAVE